MLKINKAVIPLERAYILFFLANILSFVKLFNYDLKAGMLISILLIVLFFTNIEKISISRASSIFLIFLFIELFSIINYFFIPLSGNFILDKPNLIFEFLSFLIVPQAFFFIVGIYIGGRTTWLYTNIFYIIIINSILISIGILFYFLRPQIYLNFHENTFSQEQLSMYHGYFPRLTSYMSSLVVGVMCSTNFILVLYYIKTKLFRYLLLLTFALGSFLSLERASWAGIIVSCLIYFMSKIRLRKLIIKKPRIGIKIIIIAGMIIIAIISSIVRLTEKNEVFNKFNAMLVTRVLNISSAVSERNATWYSAFELSKDYPFGIGLGLLSHKGIENSFSYHVVDGNYFRILGEFGYIGLSAFLLLIWYGLYLANKKKQYGIAVTLLIFLMHAIGTNVFDLYYISYLFWLILGIAYSKEKSSIDIENVPENIKNTTIA